MSQQSGVTFPPTFPPTLMNLYWRSPGAAAANDMEDLGVDFARHLSEGPCPCYMLVLLAAHSGPPRLCLCWIYNDFRDVEREFWFWRRDASAEFLREHRAIGRRYSAAYQGGRDLWMVLRDDLSHQPQIAVSDFAKLRYIKVDEVRLRPGHGHEFAELRQAIATAYASANVDGPVWVYEIYSGESTDSFQIWTPYSSVTQLDLVRQIRKSVDQALGDTGRTRVAEMASASISESQTTLLAISPGATYAPPNLKAADPDFWNSRTRPFP